MAMEEAQLAKRARQELPPAPMDMDLEADFMRRIGLREVIVSGEEKKEEDKGNLVEVKENMVSVKKSVLLLSDTLMVMKGQCNLDDMMVDVGGCSFIGKKDVAALMEKYLPEDCLFGFCV
eukprot:8501050-Ditylum_brightwellii.AAC.1